MDTRFLIPALVLTLFAGCAYSAIDANSVSLSLLSTSYLPSSYDGSGNPSYMFGSDSAEAIAYDPSKKVAYVVGKPAYLYVVAFNATTGASSIPAYKRVENSGSTRALDFCGGLIAVCGSNTKFGDNGFVYFISSTAMIPPAAVKALLFSSKWKLDRLLTGWSSRLIVKRWWLPMRERRGGRTRWTSVLLSTPRDRLLSLGTLPGRVRH
eukprot:m.10740 g.10740  ORF g.10740 m.10740 type:complete len:209 (+) comp22611_c0_seq2:222-848(+)